MKEYLELIDKYGIKPLFLVAIVWLNSRLNTVEEKLYDCYQDRIEQTLKASDFSYKIKERQLAILPTNPVGRIERNEKRNS